MCLLGDSLYCYLIYSKQAQGCVSMQHEECVSHVAEVIIVGALSLQVASGCSRSDHCGAPQSTSGLWM
jgi:hypothetical protein